MHKIPKALPVEPLLPWIRECCERETAESFAARCGVLPKRISDYTAGRVERIAFDTLDKMIANEGSRSIMDFYPEYDDPEAFALYESVGHYRVVEPKTRRGCSIEGCDSPHHAKGMCNPHYREHNRMMNKNKVVA
ncbi:MAG: hypothetical protein WCK43_07020 [bacterium]